MIVHDLEQGSKEWHLHRAKYRNASESPIVMGLSPYKTREQFRNERVLGIRTEINQFLAERGHQWEERARPFMEALVQEDLFQVVGTEGAWSASFDGITFDHRTVAEHKMCNDDIRKATCIHDLSLHYRVQMEHQAMVSGCEAVLFCATTWKGISLLPADIKHFWYEPCRTLREQILEAWEEFEAEVRFYRYVLGNTPAVLKERLGKTL